MSKSIILILILISLFSTNLIIASSPQEIEQQIQSDLKKEKLSPRKQYYLYVLAGREFLYSSNIQLAKKYYTKARELKVYEDKSEVYINLISVAIRKNDTASIRKSVSNAKRYFAANPNYNKGSYSDYLNLVLKTKIFDSSIKEKDFSSLSKGFYNFEIRKVQFEELIKKKKYRMALAKLDPNGVSDAGVQYEILYDLLRVLVLKKSIKSSQLLCAPRYKKFPDDYSYTMMICGSLHEYLKHSKVSNKSISQLEKYFSKRYSDKSYLLLALKELK
ncbi:hypothetical protein A9Q84_00965 [Halobacteriovorax marinus]|uniref:Uncharacterized protein n=1 Tax=Halobacteriovorax marinus TaxID=97084 RepID=A0A1Y5FBP5_9BACT|nr:hypothetical protein A9Q84_00965 [Halobacteriovorax marinus]